MLAEQVLLVANEVQGLAQLVVVRRKEAHQEREERDVPLVAHQPVLVKVVHGGVAEAPLLLGPVQVLEVPLDGVEDLLVALDVLFQAEGVRDV